MCSFVEDVSHNISRNETYPGYCVADWDGTNATTLSVRLYVPNETTPYQMALTKNVRASNTDFDDMISWIILTLNVDANCDTEHTQSCTKYPFAARHPLYPCIKTLNSSISEGNSTETVMSSIPLKKTNSTAIILSDSENLTWSLATNETLRAGKRTLCTVSKDQSPENNVAVSLNGTLPIVKDSIEPVKYYADDCVWQIDFVSALAIHQSLSYMFDGSPLAATTENTIATRGPGWLKTYYRNGTVDLPWAQQYMAGLADAMTARMRQSGDTAPEQYAQGQVLALQTCIRVDWAWLSLPIAMVLLTIAFLGATIRSCVKTRTWVGAWRSSSLAAFYSWFDGETRATAGEVVLRSEMEEKSKVLFLQLTKADDGVRFVMKATA
jgi:hypothetical protein